MAPPEPKSLQLPDRKRAIHELLKGREVAARLGDLLRRSSSGEGGRDEAGELAEEVLMALSKALSALDSGELSEAPPSVGDSSLCSDDGRSVVSTVKRKARPAGDRRGGQRRRSHAYAYTVRNKTLDDGYTWRKYGQKGIQSAKYPRSYFRCTHKHDRGCQAVRQVQKSEEDDSIYVITYMGQHTCMNSAKAAPTGAGRDSGESFLISFGASGLTVDGGEREAAAAPPAFVDPMLKQECCADDDSLSNLSRNDSSSEYLMLPELAAVDMSVPLPVASGTTSEIGDTTSGLQHSSCMSPGSLEVDFAVEPLEFGDMFLDHEHFDFKSFPEFDENSDYL